MQYSNLELNAIVDIMYLPGLTKDINVSIYLVNLLNKIMWLSVYNYDSHIPVSTINVSHNKFNGAIIIQV